MSAVYAVCREDSARQPTGPRLRFNYAVQQLSAIELARNARIAANRAFFASMSASYAPGGGIAGAADRAPLPVDHPLVLAAARELAEKAALEQARIQVGCHQHLYIFKSMLTIITS